MNEKIKTIVTIIMGVFNLSYFTILWLYIRALIHEKKRYGNVGFLWKLFLIFLIIIVVVMNVVYFCI